MQVSWVRTDDVAILSFGNFTYTTDPRIRLIYTNYQDGPNFGLKIYYVEPKDAGTYECIINTRPETIQKFELAVNNGKIETVILILILI